MRVTLIERLKNYQKKLKIYNTNKRIEAFRKDNEKTGRFKNMSGHIIISGEPRGGTTWLSEVFVEKNSLVIWEPLHFRNLRKYRVNNFNRELGFMPYIPQGESWEEAKLYFTRLFTGTEFHNNLSYWDSENEGSFNSIDQLIFKFCRANMLLPWLVDNFDIIPIYLVRNPLSVISSQYRHKAFDKLGEAYNIFKAQKSKYDFVFKKYEDRLNAISRREEMFANWWAINNVIPLTHPYNNKKWLTVSYESLLTRPEFELDRISKRLNKNFSSDILEKIKKPSNTTQSDSAIFNGGNQLLSWTNKLTSEEVKNILRIVGEYGLDQYNEGELPDYKKLGYEM